MIYHPIPDTLVVLSDITVTSDDPPLPIDNPAILLGYIYAVDNSFFIFVTVKKFKIFVEFFFPIALSFFSTNIITTVLIYPLVLTCPYLPFQFIVVKE